jgi:hypothetical protein
MARLVLHIGLPKTGTSAIQEFLAANSDALAAHNVRWCRSLRGPNHAQLALAVSRRPGRVGRAAGVVDDADRARMKARVATRLGAELRGHGTVLASTEHLTGRVRTEDELRELHGLIGAVADDVLVLLVLRRNDYWLPSSYAEAVVARSQRSLNAGFVRSRAHLLDHHALLTRWTRVFGGSNVRLLPMLEDDKADPARTPLRLLGQLGVAPDDVRRWRVPPARARLSLSARGTQLLRALTPLVPEQGLRPARDRMRLLQALADRYPGPPVLLTRSAAAELQRCGWVHNGIDRVAQAVGTGWDSWATQPPAPVGRPPTVTPDEVRALLAELQDAGVLRRRSPAAGRVREVLLRLR